MDDSSAVVAACGSNVLAFLTPERFIPSAFLERRTQVIVLAAAFATATLALFSIDLSNPYFIGLFRLFIAPPFPGIGWATAIAVAILIAIFATTMWEARLGETRPRSLRTCQIAALAVSILFAVVGLIDYASNPDPFHYLTLVGPAIQTIHGGTPMVDAFSQYGPGPLFFTLMAFAVGPRTFASVQTAVQAANALYFALFLVLLFRTSRLKIASLALGIVAILALLATWDFGKGDIHVAPSVLGFRYLPTLAMVFAISCLRPPARSSIYTALCTCIAGLWAIETFAFTLAIHVAFICALAFRDRSFAGLPRSLSIALLPVAASIAIMSTITLVRAGSLPDYGIYLSFLQSYNPITTFWGAVASPLFLGWSGVLAAVLVVFTDVWSRIMKGLSFVDASDDTLYYTYFPIAIFAVESSCYFVFRSYDYTLIMAIPPFAALAIPATLRFVETAVKGRAYALMLLPAAILVPVLAFSLLALSRPDTPYEFYLQACRDHQRCTPAKLLDKFVERLHAKLVVEPGLGVFSERWRTTITPESLLVDAISTVQQLAPPEDRVTILLGAIKITGYTVEVSSDLAFLYTGKGSRWNTSFVFTDELIPELVQRIVNAPVQLQPGELVIVNSDETTLGPIEAGILRRIKAETKLCPVPIAAQTIVAYRVGGPDGCGSASLDPLHSEPTHAALLRIVDLAPAAPGVLVKVRRVCIKGQPIRKDRENCRQFPITTRRWGRFRTAR